MYASAALVSRHRLVRLDIGTPTYMRAPGESSGSFALESAMDELAHELKMDPLELRLRNYAEVDPSNGKPFSSKSLRTCYRMAAERFGWERANPRRARHGATAGWWGWAWPPLPIRPTSTRPPRWRGSWPTGAQSCKAARSTSAPALTP